MKLGPFATRMARQWRHRRSREPADSPRREQPPGGVTARCSSTTRPSWSPSTSVAGTGTTTRASTAGRTLAKPMYTSATSATGSSTGSSSEPRVSHSWPTGLLGVPIISGAPGHADMRIGKFGIAHVKNCSRSAMFTNACFHQQKSNSNDFID